MKEKASKGLCVSVSLYQMDFLNCHKEESRRVGLTMEHASAALFYLTRMDECQCKDITAAVNA